MIPKVSVCIDSFNYGRFLPEAIDSVLRQSWQDFEIIISDDRSTDDSWAIAQRYAAQDPRIIAAQNPQNLGMVKNRNAALARARGEFVKTLHADDFLVSENALARMVAALESNPAVSLVAAARRIVDETGKPLETWAGFEETARPIAGTTVINRCLFEQRNLIG
ncbi:MAG: glycosyltransferase family 2 protein, partial [Chthoniobacterales bacterium]